MLVKDGAHFHTQTHFSQAEPQSTGDLGLHIAWLFWPPSICFIREMWQARDVSHKIQVRNSFSQLETTQHRQGNASSGTIWWYCGRIKDGASVCPRFLVTTKIWSDASVRQWSTGRPRSATPLSDRPSSGQPFCAHSSVNFDPLL